MTKENFEKISREVKKVKKMKRIKKNVSWKTLRKNSYKESSISFRELGLSNY